MPAFFVLPEMLLMYRLLPALLALMTLIAAPTSGHAADNSARRYELPNLDTLELTVPAAWEDTIDQPTDGGPPTILLRPREGATFEIYITPAWASGPDETAPDVEMLRETVRGAAERVREQAGREPIEIRRLQGSSGVGFYFFVATDDTSETEEFRYMNQGALLVGDLTVGFTILTNDGQDAVVEEALAMLTRAAHRRTGLDQH
jgi:hypothetical protein